MCNPECTGIEIATNPPPNRFLKKPACYALFLLVPAAVLFDRLHLYC